MLHKTQAIVFKYVKYRETSIIATLFTREFGIRGYIINGIRNKASKNKIALFQPLTCLDLVVYNKESADINRISELKCSHPFHSIPFNFKKSAIALFLTEILYKTIKEQHRVEDLFEFLQKSILLLDNLDDGFENFHIQFLSKLTQYLGFGIQEKRDDEIVQFELTNDAYNHLKKLAKTPYNKYIPMHSTVRNQLLQNVIQYYRIHYTDFGEIKSLPVLTQVIHH